MNEGMAEVRICIHEDGSVRITDEKNKVKDPLPPNDLAKINIPPIETCSHAYWFRTNPTCVWFSGGLY